MSFNLKKMGMGHGKSSGKADLLAAQVHNRRANDRAIIENPLAHFDDVELEEDVRNFTAAYLPSVDSKKVLRAARVAKDIRLYDEIARTSNPALEAELPVILSPEEKKFLKRERDVVFSEKGMRTVIITVSLAALLQGFVQSSFNGASLYGESWGVAGDDNHWIMGAANGSPWFAAALLGCPLSLPINYWFGRRGGLIVSAILIIISSIGSIFAQDWVFMFCIRIVNGIGMGVKAVSTTILASETAVGFWRGTTILAWQLWVAFGIFLGFAFNLIFSNAKHDHLTFCLIQGSPIIPALLLLGMAVYCPESPRYHMMKGPNYSPEKAYKILLQLRNTELQALRDMYAVYKSIEQEFMGMRDDDPNSNLSPGFWWTIWDFCVQFKQLFIHRRLYNALLSAGVVNLAQQLCGVNVLAFYSGALFSSAGANKQIAMGYSLGFGFINFVFCLPAVRSIDTLGRRRWLLMTLPFMALFMMGASLSFAALKDDNTRSGVVALFLFLFAIAYSPGLGPIPFTLAAENFPLSHREAGTATPISINFFFAGLLSVLYPSMVDGLTDAGSLGLFCVLNIVAFVLVFFLVEETKGHSLEDLDLVFAVSKRRFMSYQIREYLPWFVKRYIRNMDEPRPELYTDMIWGPFRRGSDNINTFPDLQPAYTEDEYDLKQPEMVYKRSSHLEHAPEADMKPTSPIEMPATPMYNTAKDYPEPSFR